MCVKMRKIAVQFLHNKFEKALYFSAVMCYLITVITNYIDFRRIKT